MSSGTPLVFVPAAGHEFGHAVCTELGLVPAAHEEREFEDGEHKTRPLENVRGRDVYVVQSLHTGGGQSVNDKLCRMLFLLGALRDASAGRITAVAPYLCYARKDRRTKPRDPVTTRYVAALFEAMRIDRILTMDVHNSAAYENAFHVPAEQLEARPLLVRHFASILTRREPVVVVSPDIGGAKRAEAFRQSLSQAIEQEVSGAIVEKYRSAGVVTGEAVAGDVGGRVAIIVDDLISSGGTLARAASACRNRGAVAVHAAATHGLFNENAPDTLGESCLASVVVTSTVPPQHATLERLGPRLVVVDVAPLFAEAIGRLHGDGSLVELRQ